MKHNNGTFTFYTREIDRAFKIFGHGLSGPPLKKDYGNTLLQGLGREIGNRGGSRKHSVS
jgi:hypothetical protein